MELLDANFFSRPLGLINPSGDGWQLSQDRAQYRIICMDAIGHGAGAHQIVEEIQKASKWMNKRSSQLQELSCYLRNLHDLLKRKNSVSAQAAITAIDIDKGSQQLRYIAIGNVDASFVSRGGLHKLGNLRGMLGGRLPRTLEIQAISIEESGFIVVTTDGVTHRDSVRHIQAKLWARGLTNMRSSDEARTVVELFGSKYDDSSCGLVKIERKINA